MRKGAWERRYTYCTGAKCRGKERNGDSVDGRIGGAEVDREGGRERNGMVAAFCAASQGGRGREEKASHESKTESARERERENRVVYMLSVFSKSLGCVSLWRLRVTGWKAHCPAC